MRTHQRHVGLLLLEGKEHEGLWMGLQDAAREELLSQNQGIDTGTRPRKTRMAFVMFAKRKRFIQWRADASTHPGFGGTYRTNRAQV